MKCIYMIPFTLQNLTLCINRQIMYLAAHRLGAHIAIYTIGKDAEELRISLSASK